MFKLTSKLFCYDIYSCLTPKLSAKFALADLEGAEGHLSDPSFILEGTIINNLTKNLFMFMKKMQIFSKIRFARAIFPFIFKLILLTWNFRNIVHIYFYIFLITKPMY